MPTADTRINNWIAFALKGAITVIGSMFAFYITTTGVGLNSSIESLNHTIGSLQKHLDETDRQLLELKIAEQETAPKLNAASLDISELKKRVDLMTLRLTTIEENLTRHKIY